MRRLAILLLATIPAWSQIAGPVASVSVSSLHGKPIALGTFSELERTFDSSLGTIGGVNDPVDLLGATRGLYLDGYGAVFTTEMSLLLTPGISPFKQSITPQEIAQVHQKKIDRLPKLKETMRAFLRSAAMKLFTIPENQQIVVAVRLDYMKWENTLGLPGLVMMKASRADAFDEKIKVEEQ